MPRQPRLDAPGLLQHVMARGIERRKIFRDDKDRESFLERFAIILEETQSQCYVYPVKCLPCEMFSPRNLLFHRGDAYSTVAKQYLTGAWALIPNHFHLLLRTGPTPLSKVMRRLMTGYAVTFNKRHKRSGHLFQNRYKSVVCEEDPYLLELIRYIHLNPLRAKLVQDLKELDTYPWSGHSAILGRRKNPLLPKEPYKRNKRNKPNKPNEREERNEPDQPIKSLAEKSIEDALLHFGETKKDARRGYRDFVSKGIDQGTREDLQGGGLVRSAGGNKAGLLGRKKEEREKGDERILGSGDFVNEALRKAGEDWEKGQGDKISLSELVEKVASHLDLKTERIISASRRKEITEARSLVCHFAINNLSYSASEVARFLSISRVNAGRCAERGKKALLCRETVFPDIMQLDALNDEH